MFHALDKVHPKFRNLTDLLFYSDRMDLDVSEYKSLLREERNIHTAYLWDRFQTASTIFWEHGSDFWKSRLEIIHSLNEKALSQNVDEFIDKKMQALVQYKSSPSPKYDTEFQLYIEHCKFKINNGESVIPIQDYLLGLVSRINLDSLVGIIQFFIPFVFKNMDEYAELLSKRLVHHSINWNLLNELERRGIKIDRQPLFQLAENLLFTRALNDKNRRALFTLMTDQSIMSSLKNKYSEVNRPRLLDFVRACEYQDIENNHLENIKNILILDPLVGDELAVVYADKLFNRRIGHKKANADRLIRLLKRFPQIQPKKVLAYLSSNNRMNDVKYILTAFPDLKKLAAFV